jgi:carboxylesterase
MPSTNPNLHNPNYEGDAFFLNGSVDGVLLFHGFTATTLEVRPFAEYIHAQTGSTVSVPLLPGHGTSPEDLSTCKYKDWLDAAENAFSALCIKSRTVVIGGESMGGLLALILAARHPEIKGILLFAPALITPGLHEAKILKWFIFGSPKKNLTNLQNGFLPWQGYKINPLKAVVELGKLQSYASNLIPKVTQPTIIFQGKQDETIDPKGSTIIYHSISSSNRQLIEVENCGHCILLDKQYPRIYQLALQFIQQIQMD